MIKKFLTKCKFKDKKLPMKILLIWLLKEKHAYKMPRKNMEFWLKNPNFLTIIQINKIKFNGHI
jgi:hypothetical protein